ncbi:MAG: hypothetical protein B7Z10_00320 [Rhodobacterales bacterium 32-66-7]|nr:MAG: hypothetical protein B7Z10_00320 [Rhodobacterales bacterium 32-66-7]OZA14356.1 MAG: hypothetical protein B7Y02_04675 [Rhodobacterales bacterium 17-64-5]
MKTGTLIRALAADTALGRRPETLLLTGLLVSVGVMLLSLWLTLGFRADLAGAIGDPLSAFRFVLAGSLALISLRLIRDLTRPERAGRVRLWPLAVVLAAALAVMAWAALTTPPEAFRMALFGKTAVICLIAIPLLSLVPVAVIMAALRRGATTAPALAGGVAGLCGGGLAAMVYALYCTEKSPLFYVTWYGLGIIGVTLASALIGARLLRW